MDVVREVSQAPNGMEALAQVMRYILEVNEHVTAEALEAVLERELGSEAKDAIVTAGQQLIEQGRQQGIEQGRQQGVQELLVRLLRQRFGDAVGSDVEHRITSASLEQIEAWSLRVLSVASLAELFAD
jgi:hypothetical protein